MNTHQNTRSQRTDNAVFELIHEHGPISAGDITAKLGCSGVTTTASLKRLLLDKEIQRLHPTHPQWPATADRRHAVFIVTRCTPPAGTDAAAAVAAPAAIPAAPLQHASGARA
ncbi:MAG: hypothetical protein RLY71_460 [Pseudomonadota bacterium]|jgi:hypothetical protein